MLHGTKALLPIQRTVGQYHPSGSGGLCDFLAFFSVIDQSGGVPMIFTLGP
jgi:hypothetical protein